MDELLFKDTAPVRPGEEIDCARLEDYLRGKIEGIEDGLRLEQFPGGHSNLTYLLRAGPFEYVLRRPPHGPVAPKAHDMAREFRVLEAVHPCFPAAPRPYLLCEDSSVIGAPFYLMERRKGVVLRTQLPENWSTPEVATRLSQAFVDCLVALHSLDLERHGLLGLGKPQGFVARQVRGWAERWRRARTADLPEMDRVIAYLEDNIPEEGSPALVHNDFKLDNLMFAGDDPGRIVAVLDWEMTTVGDPLIDLGLALCYWDPPDAQVRAGPVPCLSRGPGWFTRQQLVAAYAARTGRDLSALAFHEILGIFKLAVIVQQIYFRWHCGQTRDERFATFDRRVKSLAEAAFARVEAF